MKLLIMTLVLLNAFVACNNKDPETKLNEQREEATSDYREDVRDAQRERMDEARKDDEQRMEDRTDYQEDIDEATKERNKELNEAKEDYIEDVND